MEVYIDRRSAIISKDTLTKGNTFISTFILHSYCLPLNPFCFWSGFAIYTIVMVRFLAPLGCLAVILPLVAAAPATAPAPTAAPNLENRATTCTFTNAASASKSKTSCATIVLNNIAVPSGTTLDLTKLTKGTHVIFEGTTTFGYEEWSGPLISVSGTDITVTGASGSLIDGDGARWWDGEGSNGGKTKPKFFYAHSLTSSSITGLNFKDSPVQLMSINSATDLTVTDVSLDNSNGVDEGHNTDAFDIGSSTGVTISGANM